MAAALPGDAATTQNCASQYVAGHVLAEMTHMKRIAAQAEQRLCMAMSICGLSKAASPLVSAHTGNWEINMVVLQQMGFGLEQFTRIQQSHYG